MIIAIAIIVAVSRGTLSILGIADGIATERTQARADCRALQAATALIANNATDGGTAKSTDHGARLGIRTRGT